MAKRLLCVLLSVLMVVAMLPMGIVADSTSTTFTFSDVTVTARWDSSTTYPASDDGSLSWTFTSNYSEIWFELPSTVSGTVTSVTLNDVVMSSGSTSDLCIKVYGDSTTVNTSYNSASATLSTSEIETMSTASTVNVGIMSCLSSTTTIEDVTDGVTVTIGSVTVTTEPTTSGDTGDDDSGETSGTVTTVAYTFNDVEQNTDILDWGYSDVTISDAGALTVTLTGSNNGGGIAFDLPSGIDVATLTNISFSFVDFSDYTYLEIDLYVDGTKVASKYGSTSIDCSTYTSELTSSNVVSFVIKNNTYNADEDNTISRTWTVSSFSVTAVQETSSDDDTGDTGDTTDYTFPIEGVAMGGTGSASYDSTTGTITFTSGTWTSSGWWFGSGSTVKLESLTITFAEATSHYMNVAVEYTDSTESTSVAINSGSTSVTVTPEDAYIKQIYIADSNSNGGTLKIANVTYTVASDEEETTPTFYGKTLSLGGTIGVNFYVNFTGIDEASRTDYSVKFTVDGSEAEVAYSDASTGSYGSDDIVMFTCDVNCWEMGTEITAVITDGAEDYDSCTYSVATYASNMSSSNIADLASAMLTYGHYAYAYKGNGSEVSYTDVSSSVTASTLEGYKASVTSGDSSVIEASLTLDETCELSFELTEDYATGYTITIEGTKATRITDILVQDWDKTFTVVVTNDSTGETVCEIEYSVLSYAYTVVNNSSDYATSLVNLVKAMYLYNAAADAYIG